MKQVYYAAIFVLVFGASAVFGQAASSDQGSSLWIYLVLIAGVGALGAFIIYRMRAKTDIHATGIPNMDEVKRRPAGRGRVSSSSEERKAPVERRATPRQSVGSHAQASNPAASSALLDDKSDIARLPVSAMLGLNLPEAYIELEDSEDDALLDAIDQCNEDAASDAEMRSLAMRVLARFKNRNSVETLSQIALYDLSVNLRSKAVAMLADLDHESVFETLVLSCADPSREVRAAGARALFRLSFDRADAWTRIVMNQDDLHARQIARAAVEAGLAERSFDRLIHRDEKAAYEAFALMFLLVKSGETEKIFEAVGEHRDLKIRAALLHVLRVANVSDVAEGLNKVIATYPLPLEISAKAREVADKYAEIRA